MPRRGPFRIAYVTHELTLRDYLAVLWSGRWLVLGLVALAAVIGALTTVASAPQYTATSQLSLGQATTLSGVPVQTPYTNAASAPTTLKNDELVGAVARDLDLKPGVVRSAVTLTAPRVAANAGNTPTILTVTATSGDRDRAIAIANGYAEAVFDVVKAPFAANQKLLADREARARARVDRLNSEITALRQSAQRATGETRLTAIIALSSAVEQLDVAQGDAENAALAASKASQVEAPRQLAVADSAASSGAAPRRVQSILFAAMVGLLLGVIATFIWKGSPGGRARA